MARLEQLKQERIAEDRLEQEREARRQLETRLAREEQQRLADAEKARADKAEQERRAAEQAATVEHLQQENETFRRQSLGAADMEFSTIERALKSPLSPAALDADAGESPPKGILRTSDTPSRSSRVMFAPGNTLEMTRHITPPPSPTRAAPTASAAVAAKATATGELELTQIEKDALEEVGHTDAQVIAHFRKGTFTRLVDQVSHQKTGKDPDEQRQQLLRLKLEAARIFKTQKEVYEYGVGVPFEEDRLDAPMAVRTEAMSCYTAKKLSSRDKMPAYRTLVAKIDRTTFKHTKDDILILSQAALFIFSHPKVKLKCRIPIESITRVQLSCFYDGIIVITTDHTAQGDKGGHIFDVPHPVEFVAHLSTIWRRCNGAKGSLKVDCVKEIDIGSIKKNSVIAFKLFGEPGYSLEKSGKIKKLVVTATKVMDADGFTNAMRRNLRRRANDDE